MSPNDDRIVEATLLFVSQLKQFPVNVVANCNALLEDSGIRLEIVCEKEHKTPAEASLFDFQQRSPQEQIRLEENHDGAD
jgi:hypothetical protein